jgi:hypothetical protein
LGHLLEGDAFGVELAITVIKVVHGITGYPLKVEREVPKLLCWGRVKGPFWPHPASMRVTIKILIIRLIREFPIRLIC